MLKGTQKGTEHLTTPPTRQVSRYTDVPAVDEILAQVEEGLLESTGRFQAQRLLAIFAEFYTKAQSEPRNIFKEIYEAGIKQGQKPFLMDDREAVDVKDVNTR